MKSNINQALAASLARRAAEDSRKRQKFSRRELAMLLRHEERMKPVQQPQSIWNPMGYDEVLDGQHILDILSGARRPR